MNHQNGLANVHGCNEWNTCYEEKLDKKSNSKGKNNKVAIPTLLNDVKKQDIIRVSTGLKELDRVLGGGLVGGSLTILGGEPRNSVSLL